MFFSIVLPTYNVASYIERCLKSLQNQTYTDFEMIFVDDCGEDGSITIVEQYQQQDPRIRVIKNKRNLGTYHARRVGVASARGEYIVFVDPDDELNPELLNLASEVLEEKEYDIVFYGVRVEPKPKFYQNKIYDLPLTNESSVLNAVYKKRGKRLVWGATPGKFFKKTFLIKAYDLLNVDESFRYVFREDELLFYTVLLHFPSYGSIKYKGYVYHLNDNSITNSDNLKNNPFLMCQLEFTNKKLREIVSTIKLPSRESSFFIYLLDHLHCSQLAIMKRYEGGRWAYIKHVWSAFLFNPRVKEILRIALFFLSLGKVRL